MHTVEIAGGYVITFLQLREIFKSVLLENIGVEKPTHPYQNIICTLMDLKIVICRIIMDEFSVVMLRETSSSSQLLFFLLTVLFFGSTGRRVCYCCCCCCCCSDIGQYMLGTMFELLVLVVIATTCRKTVATFGTKTCLVKM